LGGELDWYVGKVGTNMRSELQGRVEGKLLGLLEANRFLYYDITNGQIHTSISIAPQTRMVIYNRGKEAVASPQDRRPRIYPIVRTERHQCLLSTNVLPRLLLLLQII
jgi:hypothetical protein